jgi:hypothetical protein
MSKGTQQRWREAILGQRESGLTIREFCEQRKLSRPSFFLWRKRLGMAKQEAAVPALPVTRCGKSKPSKSLSKGFIPAKGGAVGFVRLMPRPALEVGLKAEWMTIRIETPNGYRVQAGQMGEEGLKSVLTVLKCI